MSDLTAGPSNDLHDPGPAAVRARMERLRPPKPALVRTGTGGEIATGTASWTDPTMIAPGVFYPSDASTPERRLRYYASLFPLVEVDSTYYAIPARRMAELWAERTPEHFTFNVKAHALMTGHPTEVKRLPAELRDALPAKLARAARVYAKDLPDDINDEVWRLFTDALEPLRQAGKLGPLLLQYPRWFGPSRVNAQELEQLRQRLPEHELAIEFRQEGWLAPRLRERTLLLLERNRLSYVVVDEPQGMRSSVPPVVAVTTPARAIFRLHGHKADTWEKPVFPVSERYRYLYDREQLTSWAERILDGAGSAERVHVVFNNCYANYGASNALEIAEILEARDSRR